MDRSGNTGLFETLLYRVAIGNLNRELRVDTGSVVCSPREQLATAGTGSFVTLKRKLPT
jgi:hypothetical protein